jgi:hypothetical protein
MKMEVVIANGKYKDCKVEFFFKDGVRYFRDDELNCDVKLDDYKIKMENNPSGLEKSDTLEDAFKRADQLASPSGSFYSGMLIGRKDLRRIVLLTREVRKLQEQLTDKRTE